MEEKLFSIELKYFIDDFEFQIAKVFDKDCNIKQVNKDKFFELKENKTVKDIVYSNEFIKYLINNCGVKNYSDVTNIYIDQYEETDNLTYKKSMCSCKGSN